MLKFSQRYLKNVEHGDFFKICFDVKPKRGNCNSSPSTGCTAIPKLNYLLNYKLCFVGLRRYTISPATVFVSFLFFQSTRERTDLERSDQEQQQGSKKNDSLKNANKHDRFKKTMRILCLPFYYAKLYDFDDSILEAGHSRLRKQFEFMNEVIILFVQSTLPIHCGSGRLGERKTQRQILVPKGENREYRGDTKKVEKWSTQLMPIVGFGTGDRYSGRVFFLQL